MGFPADRAGGARKKFFSPNPVEFWLDAWCLPCLQDAMENVEANVCLPFVCFAYKTAWRTLCSSL